MKQILYLKLVVYLTFTAALLLNACSAVVPADTDGENESPSTMTAVTETIPSALSAITEAVSEQNTPHSESTLMEGSPQKAVRTVDVSLTPTIIPTITGTPTPDLRLPPEDWQNWSVIPQVSGTAIDIYRRGIAMGNNPRAFSKVGDCQAIKEVLMGIYDLPGRYFLTEQDQYLQETIDNFAGSFNRDGMAVKGGFNAAAVLSPLWADPDMCLAGETPLECEFRVHNPSIVIISLEVWWEGRTVERYEAYMRRIIEQAIAEGIVPILSTKADNVEGDHSINAATVRLAYEYDIPLWNFWLAVQGLPNHGIDPDRDGFHISTQAWDVRSYTALKAVDAVWRACRENPIIEATSTPVVEPTADLILAPTVSNVPLDEDKINLPLSQRTGSITFGVAERSEEHVEYKGIYSLDLENMRFLQLALPDHRLQSASSDGKYLLYNRGANLLLFDVDKQTQQVITDKFFSFGKLGAYWLTDHSGFVYIHESPEGNTLHLSNIKDRTDQTISIQGANPIEVYPFENPAYLAWVDGSCQSFEVCERKGTWLTSLADQSSRFWGNYPQLAFGKGSPFYAYQLLPADQLVMAVGELDNGFIRQIPLGGEHFMEIEWSPVESKLAALTLVRSEYSGKPSAIRVFLLNVPDWKMKEYSPVNGTNAQVSWSPDGKSLLITSTEFKDDQYHLHFRFKDLQTDWTYDLGDALDFNSENYIYITNIFWIDPDSMEE